MGRAPCYSLNCWVLVAGTRRMAKASRHDLPTAAAPRWVVKVLRGTLLIGGSMPSPSCPGAYKQDHSSRALKDKSESINSRQQSDTGKSIKAARGILEGHRSRYLGLYASTELFLMSSMATLPPASILRWHVQRSLGCH